MSSVDNIDYASLSNPILDLKMSQIGDDHDQAEYEGDQDYDAAGNIDLPNNGDGNEMDDEDDVDYIEDDPPYHPKNLQSALDDLQTICDEEGVSYTIPMENQVKSLFTQEAMCYSHLTWYVRGIIMANQTQIIPSITGAISDMKMETKHMQQSSNKLNKETASIERVAKSLSLELSSIKEDIQESFRKSMLLFMAHMEETGPKKDVLEPTETKDNLISSLKAVNEKTLTDEAVETSKKAETPDIPKPKAEMTSTNKFLDEKIRYLIKYGISADFVKQTDPEIIDAMYPDDVHARLKTVKLTNDVKMRIRSNIEARLEDILNSDEE